MLRRAGIVIALCLAHSVAVSGMVASRPVVPAGRDIVPVLFANAGFLWAIARDVQCGLLAAD
jgi:hypothetical protein